jgi:hypothetical protein
VSKIKSVEARLRRFTLFEQRKLEAKITFEYAFLDREKGELVETLTPGEIHQAISSQLDVGDRNLIDVPVAFDGLVLQDKIVFAEWQNEL